MYAHSHTRMHVPTHARTHAHTHARTHARTPMHTCPSTRTTVSWLACKQYIIILLLILLLLVFVLFYYVHIQRYDHQSYTHMRWVSTEGRDQMHQDTTAKSRTVSHLLCLAKRRRRTSGSHRDYAIIEPLLRTLPRAPPVRPSTRRWPLNHPTESPLLCKPQRTRPRNPPSTSGAVGLAPDGCGVTRVNRRKTD